jgi:hypothetical protein
MSFYKSRSGLLVPEGYERKNPYDEIRGLVTKVWYQLDDSARTTIVETITKYAAAAALGGCCSSVLLNMFRAKSHTFEDCVKAANENFITTPEHESSEEKFHKQLQEINEKLLMVQEDLKVLKAIWMIRILAKNFDPEVLSRVKQEDLHDPVQILKGEVVYLLLSVCFYFVLYAVLLRHC